MNNYPVGDYLIQIKNAARGGRREVRVRKTRFIEAISEALVKMNILESYEILDGFLTCRLSYHRKAPRLINLALVSKPGLRRYMSVEAMQGRKRRNASVLLLSTPLGVMSSKEAIKKGVGGEVIAEVW